MRKNLPPLSAAARQDNARRRVRFLTQLEAIPDMGVKGFFGPGSASWELYREPLVMLGGIRALLLQIAHPAIADGVSRYSNFQEDALDRGRRTFIAMAKIYFADAATARQTARQLHTIHSYIRGTFVNHKGDRRDYCANDPDLLLWVVATLIDTTYQVFDTILGPQSEETKQQFYRESKTTALLMGIPEDFYLPTLSEFQAYFSRMVGEELRVDDTTMKLANAILDNRYSSRRLATALAVGFLPEKLIRDFEMEDTPKVRRRFGRIIKITKTIYPLLPKYVRSAAAWHQAHYRLARQEGRSPALLGRFYAWLAKKMHVPLGI